MQLTHQVAPEQMQLSQQAMKDLYDRKSKPYPYKVGEVVWLFTPKTQKGLSKKLLHNWHGPYRLVEQLSPVNFKLHTRDNCLLPTPVHVNRLKPCTDPVACPLILLLTKMIQFLMIPKFLFFPLTALHLLTLLLNLLPQLTTTTPFTKSKPF